MAYHPGVNSLFVPYIDNCLDMTAATARVGGQAGGRGAPRRHSAARLEARRIRRRLRRSTWRPGEIQHIYKGRAPGQGAVLATAGDLVFWGDLDQKFRAFDAESGKILGRRRWAERFRTARSPTPSTASSTSRC